jgi:hypothetical protein
MKSMKSKNIKEYGAHTGPAHNECAVITFLQSILCKGPAPTEHKGKNLSVVKELYLTTLCLH